MKSPSTELARGLVDLLLSAGVRDVVIAPGSRNAPLSFAARAAARAGRVRLHTRIDERSAGFLALGLTRAGSRAAVICTSGTAVANLHPALLEAAHIAAPLIALTADRPASKRGTNSNQTTDQVGVFGPLIDTVDLDHVESLSRVRLDPAGPTHLNVQFSEPLMPDGDWTPSALPAVDSEQDPIPEPVVVRPGPGTVVVAGDSAGPAARQLAEDGGWPLLAEPGSGARSGPNALRCYRLLLGSALGERIERVVVLGHPTLSRPVTRLLERDDVEVIEVPAAGVWNRRPFAARTVAALRVDRTGADSGGTGGDWLAEWVEADQKTAARLDHLIAQDRGGAADGLDPYRLAAAVDASLDAEDLLVVGASSPIRDLDLMALPRAVGRSATVLANRGLAGIDGTVSTAIGAALGHAETHPGGRAVALLGDVTFLHDSNGLILGPGQPTPDLSIVVVNDNGGSIFTMLEQGAPEFADDFEDLFGTPHGVDLASLCAATRTPHWAVASLPELTQALASPNGGVEVIEARVRRDNRRELDAEIRGLGG